MKRCGDHDVVHTSLFDPVPQEILSLILVQAYGCAKNMTTVCTAWRRTIAQYTDWFSLAKTYYRFDAARWSHYFSDGVASWETWHSPAPYGGDDPTNVFLLHRHTLIDDNNNPERPIDRIAAATGLAIYYLDQHVSEAAFKNFIGRLLVAKHTNYPALLDAALWYVNDMAPVRTQLVQCRMLQALVRYVQNEAASPLVRRNFHPRDVNIRFTEEGHRYTLVMWDVEKAQYISVLSHRDCDDNEDPRARSHDEEDLDILRRDLRSMTTFIHSLYGGFDPDAAIATMKVNTKKWDSPRENKYFGLSDDQIKLRWATEGQDASQKGTAMHLNLENLCLDRPHETESKEYKLYERFARAHLAGRLRPYRTEWSIYDEELMLCGQIDIIYEYVSEVYTVGGKKHLKIGDYKRSKAITKYNAYQSGLPGTAAHYAGDCNYVHYTLQLCGYKYILEKNYGVIIDEMFLIVLHPDQEEYIRVEISPPEYRRYCDRLIDSVLAYRRQCVGEKKTWLPLSAVTAPGDF